MVAIPSRHRSLALLAAAMVVQVLLLAVQIKRQQQVRLIRVWAVSLVTPVHRAAVWGIDHVYRTWDNYIGLRGTKSENDRLRAELEQLKLRNSELESRAAEADRLGTLLGFQQARAEMRMMAARVIGASASTATQTIYVNRGEQDGVRRNMAVITPEGVVGKIIEVYSKSAQVLLLTDKESGVGALLAGSRIQSPVGGVGEPQLVMKYVASDEQVNVGTAVLTSGQDRIFPKDLPVGLVVEVKPGYPFKQIRVKPAAHLDRLEEVLILLALPQKPLEQTAAEKTAPKGAAKGAATPQ